MLSFLNNKEIKIAVIGLGYVGLPVALSFAKNLAVIGFDINADRIQLMQQGIDPSNELTKEAFDNCNIIFTNLLQDIKQANFFIVTVPTPVDEHKVPDLTALLAASETVGNAIQKGGYVVFESTVYPGCTEEDCLPIIERISGLQCGTDFKIGYSPERINPGDKEHTLENIIKVVSGCDDDALEMIANVYSLVAKAGVHKASNIKVAEAAKIIENTQRDLNIALMNELSIIFDKMNINTYEVLEAAGTKWNFLPFQPGLVGGHCIGVDPYYLTYKAAELGYTAKIVTAARYINDAMGAYVAEKIIQHIIQHSNNVREAKVLVMGATFKANVTDIRNSKIADVVKALRGFHLNVEITDAYANSKDLKAEYGMELTANIGKDYDAVIVVVAHEPYLNFDDAFFASITKKDAIIADLKGIYRGKINTRNYWSL